MKRLALIFAAALAVSGCATTQSTQVSYTQACAAYGAAFETMLQLRVAGKLNQPQIDQVTLLDSQVTPICTGPLPADPTAAATQVTAAVTALTIIEVSKKGGK
jgi:PBP1b-binding outer membrane lipoprotein LpoB